MRQMVMALDVGGTNTVMGLVTSDGNILVRLTAPTASFATFTELVRWCSAEARDRYPGSEVRAIGIGAPNMNCHEGCISCAPNLHWGEVVEVVKEFGAVFPGITVATDNDSNAAAAGEHAYGAARGYRDAIVVTIGTGLGSGIISSNRMLRGRDGLAGELGHVRICGQGRICTCHRVDCLESYVSARGVVQTYREQLVRHGLPDEGNLPSGTPLTPRLIATRAMDGDAVAEEAYRITGSILGRALTDAAAISSPEIIVIGGGVANAGEILLDPVRRQFEKDILPVHRGRIRIAASALKDGEGALLGAAALAWNRLRR